MFRLYRYPECSFWHCWGFEITRASEQPPERSFVCACEIAQFTLLFRVLCPCESMLCVCVKSHSLRLCSVWACVSLHLCSLHQAHLLAHNNPALLFSGWTALQWVGDPNLKHKELKTCTQKGTHWWKSSTSRLYRAKMKICFSTTMK